MRGMMSQKRRLRRRKNVLMLWLLRRKTSLQAEKWRQ